MKVKKETKFCNKLSMQVNLLVELYRKNITFTNLINYDINSYKYPSKVFIRF